MDGEPGGRGGIGPRHHAVPAHVIYRPPLPGFSALVALRDRSAGDDFVFNCGAHSHEDGSPKTGREFQKELYA
jgi:hypothetical protein